MLNLKPCPLCGRGVSVPGGPEEWTPTWWDPDSGGDPYRIACECGCGLDIGYCELDELVEAWNRRSNMPWIKTCKNEKCAYNSNGCYCDTMEVDIDEYGECETFWPKQEEA